MMTFKVMSLLPLRRRSVRRALRSPWLRDSLLLCPALLLVVASTLDFVRPILIRAAMAVESGAGESLSYYGPTPMPVVEAALDTLGIGPGSVLVDIGSGDGRVVVAAAGRGARAIGIDRQAGLVGRSRQLACEAGVSERAAFIHGDALEHPEVVADADAVYVFMLPEGLRVLGAWFEAGVLRDGTTVVSGLWAIPQWRPERVEMVLNTIGGTGVGFPLHYYTFGNHAADWAPTAAP
jgi:hypothetical protein